MKISIVREISTEMLMNKRAHFGYIFIQQPMSKQQMKQKYGEETLRQVQALLQNPFLHSCSLTFDLFLFLNALVLQNTRFPVKASCQPVFSQDLFKAIYSKL